MSKFLLVPCACTGPPCAIAIFTTGDARSTRAAPGHCLAGRPDVVRDGAARCRQPREGPGWSGPDLSLYVSAEEAAHRRYGLPSTGLMAA